MVFFYIKDKSFVLKSKYSFMYLKNVKEKIQDKIKLILKMSYVFKFLKINNDTQINNLIYDPNPEVFKKRIEFIKYFQNNNLYFSLNFKNYLNFNTYKQLFMFIIYYISFFPEIFYRMFKEHKISLFRQLDFYIIISYVKAIQPKEIFFFNYLSVVSYISTKYISENFQNIRINYVYTSGILYETCRYDTFKNVNIILGSKLQYDEINYYEEKKWMKLYNCRIKFWGVDNIKTIAIYSKEKIYDIAFYSSATWARPDGFLRGDNLQDIKNYKYLNNPYYKIVSKILDILKSDKYKDLKIKIYFHPFEKELMNKYGIYPPFWEELSRLSNFVLDKNQSVSNFLEAKIGIAVFSSIAFDRLNYDLDTLFFVPIQKSNKYPGLPPRKVFKTYDKYIYSSVSEFEKKLNGFINDKINN